MEDERNVANERRLIDANQLIKRLEVMKHNTDAITIDGIIRALKEPSTVDAVETVQEWISVKDRLPQEDEPEGAICEQVQVLLDNGVVSTGWCNRHTKLWWHLNYGETHFIGYDYEHTPVIAWQPLAQPPKGD